MADIPPQHDPLPDEPEVTGGWHKPQTSGIWRPAQAEKPAPGWRVPTLPSNLRIVPQAEGEWHLPRSEDTIYTAADQITIMTPPGGTAPTEQLDELALIEAASAAPATPAAASDAAPLRPEDLLLQEAQLRDTEVVETAEPAPEPAADQAADEPDFDLSDSESLLALEDTARQLAQTDADDDDPFSLSELVTLASLVEQQPPPQIVPGASSAADLAAEALSPAERALLQATGALAAQPETAAQPAAESESDSAPLDPAEYARQQAARYATGSAAPVTGAAPAFGEAASSDPAEYARQQAARYATGSAAPVTGVTAMTPEQAELARKFRDTEEQVRALREQYRLGQISRDDLQARLRALMILEGNRWWMMGVESDNWYRFEDGQWVLDNPPISAPASVGLEIGTPLTPDLRGGTLEPSLPRLPTEPGAPVSPEEYTQDSAAYRTPVPGFGALGSTTPLPRTDIPQQDPNLTQVGTAGAYLDPMLPGSQPTIPGTTVVSPGYDPYAAIEAPADDVAYAPAYDIDSQASPIYDDIAARSRQDTASTLLRVALIGVGAVILLFACGIGFLVVQYNNMAAPWQDEIAALANYRPEFQTARVLDASGNLIAELNSQQGGARTSVTLDKISPFMIHAVVSLENERFFEDPGWDWIAIFRAFLQNLGSGQIESGASTITQQIARQLVMKDSTISPERKLQEIVIAAEIAKQYSKNDILALYLNEIYFGNLSYGVEAASQFYFKHSANDLNLPEAALLAGMIAAPATYDPVRRGGEDNPTYNARREATIARMRAVIDRMAEVGCLQFQHAPYLNQPFCVDAAVIRDATVQRATVEAARYEPREVRYKYPHFVQLVQALVERDYGAGDMFRRGFVIRTTLNASVQEAAETALRNQLAQIVATGVNSGTIMVTNPRTGAILAMVGSPNFNDPAIDGQVNLALTWQQPGSAIKPVLYTAALEGVDRNGDGIAEYLTPASILWDVPTSYGGTPAYQPVNFDGRFRGPIALRAALQQSINVPAVKTYEFIGTPKFQDTANRLGLRFRDDAQFNLTTALGSTDVTLYDMMTAYGTLANNGVRSQLYAIESITDATGSPVLTSERPQPAQTVQPQIAFLMQSILSDDSARSAQFGSGGWMTVPGLPASGYVAAKTGTSNENRDLWTVGFTRNAVVGVWMGRPDNGRTFVQGGGYNVVGPVWQQVMTSALRAVGAPPPFANPGGVVEVQICTTTGAQPAANCPALRTELFVQSQLPPPADQSFVQQVEVDTWTGLRASQFCPDNRVARTFVNIPDPAAIAWLNSPAGAATAAQLGLQAGTLESLPSAACDMNTEIPIARIIAPGEGQTVSGVVEITGAASATTTFNRYQIEVASAASPNAFTIIAGPVQTPQTSGRLGEWNTQGVANGQYILRLAMFSRNGGFLYRTVRVNVVNALPTATPQPIIPTQPPILFETFTPLPFDPTPTPAPLATIPLPP